MLNRVNKCKMCITADTGAKNQFEGGYLITKVVFENLLVVFENQRFIKDS